MTTAEISARRSSGGVIEGQVQSLWLEVGALRGRLTGLRLAALQLLWALDAYPSLVDQVRAVAPAEYAGLRAALGESEVVR